jgi:hypothetical protein
LDEKAMARVRELRHTGSSPKQIARALGARSSLVGSAVRTLAAQDAASRTEPELVGCWVSPGWSAGLAVDGHPDWPDVDDPGPGRTGMAMALVARRSRSSRVSLAGFLVDVFCLGVKDTVGPRELSESRLPEFLRRFFAAFADVGEPLAVPLPLARNLVFGAVDAARRWGFEPYAEFASVADHLGTWEEESAITFGEHGVPFYTQGPYDEDPAGVLRTLDRTAGPDNYHFMIASDVAVG